MNLARINVEFKKHDFLRPVPVRSFIYSPIYILSLASDLFINFLSQTLPLSEAMEEKAVMVAEETTAKKFLGSNIDYEGLAHLF